MNSVVIQVRDKEQCCGCSACAGICSTRAINMVQDEEGFLYPIVDTDLCIQCGRCDLVCPITADHQQNDCLRQMAFAAQNKDHKVLMQSASGGVFSALAQSVLQRGGIVYGVAYDSEMKAVHVGVNSIAKLTALRDSKYVQSDLGNTFKDVEEHLRQGRIVLFEGTPCQVAGLKGFLGHSYDNLLLCDIICHSVASPLLFKEFIHYAQNEIGKHIRGMSLRDKSRGWGEYSSRILFADGSVEYNSYWAGVWARSYAQHLITRPSCHVCPYCSMARSGDITIGDYWGVRDYYPELYDKDGVSLVLANTEKGIHWINSISDLRITECLSSKTSQPCLEQPCLPHPDRVVFWKDYHQHGYAFVCKKYWGYTPLQKVKNKIKRMLNTYKQQ